MTEEPTAPKIGEKMQDGTIYAGISPDTGKPMYAMPVDAPLTCPFNQAADQVAAFNFTGYLGHSDWRLPSSAELNVLFNNRAAIGGFDTSGSYPAGSYWSSTQDGKWHAWCQRFSDGTQDYHFAKINPSSVRCVR